MKIILALIFLVPTLCLADTYQGIGFWATLGEVKALFPNATFQKLKPAWATESEVLYAIRGTGINGIIVVEFNDGRPRIRQSMAVRPDAWSQAAIAAALSGSDDDVLTVQAVKWAPDAPIPLSRLVSKFGKPTMAGFADNDMRPFREWSSRGISATLSDDEKKVTAITYEFNKADCLAYYRVTDKDEKLNNEVCSILRPTKK